MEKELAVTDTGSLKVTTTLPFLGTSTAPFAGETAVTAGGVSPSPIVKSSMARPSSEPVTLRSAQRIQNEAPLGMFRPRMVKVINVLFAARLPFRAPTVPEVTGLLKSR